MTPRRAAEIAGVAILYYVAAQIGLASQLPGTNGPAVWPPSGVGLAAMLLLGFHVWPGIAIASLVVNASILPMTAAGLAAAVMVAAGRTLGKVLALVLIRRVCPAPGDPFERVGHALWFIAVATAACLLAAIAETTVLRGFGFLDPSLYRATLVTRWVRDVAGMIILAPALYAWVRRPSLGMSAPRVVELAVLVVGTVAAGELMFGGRILPLVAASRPVLPILLWAAFRFGQRETSSLAAVVAGQAMTHTWLAMRSANANPVAATGMSALLVNLSNSPAEWLAALQMFACVTAVLALLVAAAVAERDESQRTLEDVNHTLEARVRERTGQLEASLAEKETLLREIHHRVKNNLAVVSSLLYLRSTRVDDEQTLRVLQESQHRVHSMAMVHEALYRSNNLGAVDVHSYLDGLLDYLLDSYAAESRRVRVTRRFEPLVLDTETAIPCGLIFTELVTNSLKHAFPDGRSGSLGVALQAAPGGECVLTVADNGAGLPAGAEAADPATLGWRLVSSLTRQLDGRFEVAPRTPGTEATLRFPIRNSYGGAVSP